MDPRAVVDPEETPEAAAVVVVMVGEHRHVHLLQIDPEALGIVGERARGAGVEQDLQIAALDVKRQPELGHEVLATLDSVVLDQRRHPHHAPPQEMMTGGGG